MKIKQKLAVLFFILCMVLCGCGSEMTTTIQTDNEPVETDTLQPKKEEIKFPVREGGVITLTLGFSTNDEDTRAISSRKFKEEVEAKTKGTVNIDIHSDSELGSDNELITKIVRGQVDMTISSAGNFSNYVKYEGVSALPFLFDSFEEAWHFMDSEIVQNIDEELLTYNIRVLAHFDNGFRCVTTSDIPINSVEDMKKLTIRTPNNPIIKETMSELGARPMTLDFSELRSALENGQFNSQENPIPIIYNNKLYEVQKYLSITNHSYDAMPLVISDAAWQMLTKEEQKIIIQAAADAQIQNRQLVKEQTEQYIDKLINECGMTVTYPDLQEFKDATENVAKFFCYDENTLNQINDFLERNRFHTSQ